MRPLFLALALATGCTFGDGRFTTGDASVDADAASASDADAGDTLLGGCQGWWKFDDTSWTNGVTDSCGDDDRGTALAGAELATDPARGSVANITGGCIQVADSPRLRFESAFTLSAWVNPRSTTDDQGIISKRNGFGDNSAFTTYLRKNANQDFHLWVDVDTENDRFDLADVTFALEWRHVTVVFDGTRIANERVAIYVDGVFEDFGEESSTALPPPTAPPPLSIGCLPNGGIPFDGYLDDAIVWNRALSTAEVASWFARTTR